MIEKISTIGMSRERWLEIRRGSIGGSDAGALLGLNPYNSPYSLWAEKTGKVVQKINGSQRQQKRRGKGQRQKPAQLVRRRFPAPALQHNCR